jgi:hypothetical protein
VAIPFENVHGVPLRNWDVVERELGAEVKSSKLDVARVNQEREPKLHGGQLVLDVEAVDKGECELRLFGNSIDDPILLALVTVGDTEFLVEPNPIVVCEGSETTVWVSRKSRGKEIDWTDELIGKHSVKLVPNGRSLDLVHEGGKARFFVTDEDAEKTSVEILRGTTHLIQVPVSLVRAPGEAPGWERLALSSGLAVTAWVAWGVAWVNRSNKWDAYESDPTRPSDLYAEYTDANTVRNRLFLVGLASTAWVIMEAGVPPVLSFVYPGYFPKLKAHRRAVAEWEGACGGPGRMGLGLAPAGSGIVLGFGMTF